MKPIVDAQEAILRAREREDLIPLVPRYNTFVLLLGMSVSSSPSLDSPGRNPYSIEVAQCSLRRRPAERLRGISKCSKVMLVAMMGHTVHTKYAKHSVHSF